MVVPKPIKKKSEDSSEKTKEHSWQQRKGKVSSHAIYRDLAGWLTDIAKHESRISGRRISVAMLIDFRMRDWAYSRWKRIKNAEAGVPDAQIGEAPFPPEEMQGLGLR